MPHPAARQRCRASSTTRSELRPARSRRRAPKGRSARDLPRCRDQRPESGQPDPDQAPAGGAGDRPGVRRRVGRVGRDQPQAAGARPRRRSREPPGQVALGARPAGRGPRALPDRPRARPDEPHRRAQHRPAQDAPQRGRREDRPGPGGQQGPGQHLRRGDRQDRLRLPDRPRHARASWPRSTPATRSSSSPKVDGSSRSATASGSVSWSRGSRPGCSSSWPMATSTPPA